MSPAVIVMLVNGMLEGLALILKTIAQFRSMVDLNQLGTEADSVIAESRVLIARLKAQEVALAAERQALEAALEGRE